MLLLGWKRDKFSLSEKKAFHILTQKKNSPKLPPAKNFGDILVCERLIA